VFLRLVAERRDRFLEHRINIKFCVKLGKNTSDIGAMLSEAYGGEAVKHLSVSEWHERFKIKNEDNAFHFLRHRYHFKFIPQGQTVNQAYRVEIMRWLREVMRRKRLNFGPTIEFSTMTMF
jgi:hypothetical protein